MTEQASDQEIVFTQPRLLLAIVAPAAAYLGWRLGAISYHLVALLFQKPPDTLWKSAEVSIPTILLVAVSILFVLLSYFCLYIVNCGDKLILAPDGVTVWTGRSARYFTWQSIKNFRMVALGRGT
jgi:hypothetical protein